MEEQLMTPLEFMLIITLKGKQIQVAKDATDKPVFETIKTIQKLPQIQDIVIETEEGTKKTISLDKIFNWKIDKKKDRVKPGGRIVPEKRFKRG